MRLLVRLERHSAGSPPPIRHGGARP
jgi:hypothetical protein